MTSRLLSVNKEHVGTSKERENSPVEIKYISIFTFDMAGELTAPQGMYKVPFYEKVQRPSALFSEHHTV